MRKHRIALLLLSVMLLVSVVFYPQTVSTSAFDDVSNHWAREWIETAVQKGWISGYGDGSFRPERHVTRAEFIKIVAAAAGLERKMRRTLEGCTRPLGIYPVLVRSGT